MRDNFLQKLHLKLYFHLFFTQMDYIGANGSGSYKYWELASQYLLCLVTLSIYMKVFLIYTNYFCKIKKCGKKASIFMPNKSFIFKMIYFIKLTFHNLSVLHTPLYWHRHTDILALRILMLHLMLLAQWGKSSLNVTTSYELPWSPCC